MNFDFALITLVTFHSIILDFAIALGGVPLFSILNYTSQAFDSKVEACDQQCVQAALPGHTSINHPEGNTFSNT